ncbi:chaplin family protein [Actinoplanes sp. NPDC049681]|uniref:chaplin family protein n=1 Tax=Actinoplanes sp. NPDC049681 TaxID=3363905 RepID=UPI0037959B01
MKLLHGLVLGTGAVAAALALSAGPASASTSDGPGGNVGLLNGNSVSMPVHVGANACGNALAVLGIAGGSGDCSNG